MKTYGARLLLKMAWRNLWRQRRRTLITIIAMVAGLGLCIPYYGLTEGLSADMKRGITRIHTGHIQIHNPKYPKERAMAETMPLGIEDRVAKIDGVVAVAPRVYSGGLISSDCRIRTSLIGLPSGKPLPPATRLAQGKPLDAAHVCGVLLPRSAADRWNLNLGSVLRLRPLPPPGACEKVEVRGIIQGNDVGRSPKHQTAQMQIFMFATQVQKILSPAKKEKPIDWNIDDLPKEDTPAATKANGANENGTTAKPRPKTVPTTSPAQPPRAGVATGAHGKPAPTNERRSVDHGKLAPQTPPRLGPDHGFWTLMRSESNPVGIVAIDPAKESKVTLLSEHVLSGTYLPAGHRGKGPRPILLGKRLADQLMVKPGDRIGLDIMSADGYPVDEIFTVSGIFQTGVDEMDRGMVYVPIDVAWDSNLMNLKAKTPSPIHEFAIRIREGLNEAQVAQRIRKAVGPGFLVQTWQQLDPNTAKLIQYQDVAIAIFLGIIFIIAALGTTNTMLMAVFERTKEFGVLKSVGMTPLRMATLIITETLLLTLLAAVLGTAIGLGFDYYLMVHGLDLTAYNPAGFSYQGLFIEPIWKAIITPTGVLVPVILLCSVSVIVSIWPAVKASRIRPVEALKQEG
ncbi:MAG: ABC transporter permease [Deltaproteobacteria bacterium]|nr:ABC transporter permease [Deltaproteobacteria bacterium]